MKILLRTTLFALCASLILSSCADPHTTSWEEIEQASLDTWMAAYHSDAVRQDNGLYTQMINAVPGADKPKAGQWVEILFTGWSMPDMKVGIPGNLFVTRDSTLAAHEGSTGYYHTHYAPKKLYLSLETGLITPAMYQTILMMRKGERWGFYSTSYLMYGSMGSSYDYGYQGYNPLGASVPCYMEIELVDIIDDVRADEQQQVQDYALTHLGLAAADSLKQYYYLKTEPLDAAADSIKADSTVKFYYIKRFLDGTIYDSNIDTVIQRVFKGYKYTLPTAAISYKPSNGTQMPAIYDAVTHMKYDSWGRFVFTSDYAYGYAGLTPSTSDYSAEIDPYTPLYFEIYVMPYEEEEED